MDAQRAPVAIQSRLTCPHCGTVSLETMPEDACQFFFTCLSCNSMLKPRSGDCCVFLLLRFCSLPTGSVRETGGVALAQPSPAARQDRTDMVDTWPGPYTFWRPIGGGGSKFRMRTSRA